MPKALSRQCQHMVLNLLSYFEQEKEKKGPLVPFTAVRERVANALKINISTVHSLSAKINTKEVITSPKKKKSRTKPVVKIDSFTEIAIRNVIYEMYARKIHITRQSLLDILNERDIFHGGATSLSDILKTLGFKWRKNDNRRLLYEDRRIVGLRITFLKQYVRNLKCANPLQLVFLDETWIFQKGTGGKSWQDDDPRSVKRRTEGGKRYIIVHAGTKNGFVDGASLIFASKTNNADYHGEMNQDNFTKWFKNQLLPSLEEPSLIIMDNAPYHNAVVEKFPTSAWKKQEIKNWLESKHIPTSACMLKNELLNLVVQNKPTKRYVIDDMALEHGHRVLRQPPYHCIFNAIENVWGIAKTYYNDRVDSTGCDDQKTLQLWEEALNHVTSEKWKNCIDHASKEILRWWDREVMFDAEDITPLIINLDDDSDNSESEED